MKYLPKIYVHSDRMSETADLSQVPIGKPIYGFAYSIDDDDGRSKLRCKPVLGEVYDYYGTGRILHFSPYKKGTRKRLSGGVRIESRMYADTYEEAVEMYDELVQRRIDKLNAMAQEAEKEKLTATGLPTNNIEIYSYESPFMKHIGHISADSFNREELWNLCNWSNWTNSKPENLHADIDSCDHGICFVDPWTKKVHMALSVGWLEGTMMDICQYVDEHKGKTLWT